MENNRQFHYKPLILKYNSTNVVVYPSGATRQYEIHDGIDGSLTNLFSCLWDVNTIQIGLLDSITGQPVYHGISCTQNRLQSMHEFRITTPEQRKEVVDFINSIPNGYYVSIKTIVCSRPYVGATMAPITWQADTAIYGSGNSLYHALKNLGFTEIDQTTPLIRKTFLFFGKKGDNS
jgi:hypothetical protein